MDFAKIFHDMDGFSLSIVATLLLGAMASTTVLVERLWAARRAARANDAFMAQAARLIQAAHYKELVALSDRTKGSPLAWLIGEGAKRYLSALEDKGNLSATERVRRDMERKLDAVNANIRRGLAVLASVGSVAPFVGLLGTVVGIIASFQSIAKEGSGGLGVVSAGISEALVVTALGLLVAIPSVLIFNFLTSRADAQMLVIERAQGELVDYLEHHEGVEVRRETRAA